jgi:hypothetical protein
LTFLAAFVFADARDPVKHCNTVQCFRHHLIYARGVAFGGNTDARACRGKQPVKNKGAIDMFFWEKTRESAEF